MKLVLLGTAGYHPSDARQTSCYMLPELGIVLDAGSGMYRVRDWIQTDSLDILLSHAHLDHVMGLTFLFDVVHQRNIKRISVHGAAPKLDAIRKHLFQDDLFPVVPPIDWRPLEGTLSIAGATISHFPLNHPGGSLGYRFSWPDRSLAYVTDTTARPGAAYIEQIRGVNLLLHECNFPDSMTEQAEKTGHSCTSAVAKVALAAGVGQLLLTHFDPLNTSDDPIGLSTARAIFPHIQLAADNQVVEF